MIYTQWEDVVGKTIVKVEHYKKEFTSQSIYEKRPTAYMDGYWDVLFFDDGVIIKEYLQEHHEPGDLNLINEVKDDKQPPKEVIDIIEKYK